MACEEAQILNLIDKDFKMTFLNMLLEQKETMGKQLKEIKKPIYKQNVNKEIEIIKWNQIEILDQKVQ